jgi:hypothetical protein
MADITLPRWIITQMCMPHGHRTATKPVIAVSMGQRNQSHNRFEESYSPGVYQPEVINGVFEHWEYRFWCMVTWPPSTQILAECRACGHLGEQDKAVRQGHMSQGGCAKKLCDAFDLLLRDKLCVICDVRTTRTKWGVPICSSGCMQAWCEQESQPKALLNALQLVGGQY